MILKPKEQKLIKVKAPFIDEISGMAIVLCNAGCTYISIVYGISVSHAIQMSTALTQPLVQVLLPTDK